MRITLLFLAGALLTQPLLGQDREILPVPGAVAGLPFSPAVRVGNIIYLSGQLGNDVGTRNLVPGGIKPETRRTLENIRAVLESAGSSLDRVIKCTVFLADISEYPAMNEVYASFFPTDPPARSTIAGSGLALGARVEIECMATAK